MLFKIKLEEEMKDQPVLSIRTHSTIYKLPMLIGMSYKKIMDYLKELNTEPIDVPFVAYHNFDRDDLDLEIGFPVKQTYPKKDEIQPSVLPKGKRVTAMYKGPYHNAEGAYDLMAKWISEHGYEALNISYEFYYNSPEDVLENELLTRIELLLK